MARRSGLGKGLDALIPGDEQPQRGEGTTQLPVDAIQPNPRQPRTSIDTEDLSDLAASIREYGVLQPLIVSESLVPGQYILVAGERRLKAARLAGLGFVPALVRNVTPQEQLELALIENLQRMDLTPLETAEAYRQLVEEFNLSHEDIAQLVGKSRVSITNTLRLLKLPLEIKEALSDGKITEGHARALLSLASIQAQLAALQTVIKNDLNVRQTEDLVKRLSGHRRLIAPRPSPSPEFQAIEDRLRNSLGTKVELRQGKDEGRLIIHYYSDEELNHLIDQLMNL